MPAPLGPHDVLQTGPVPVGPNDAVQDTPPPPAPHDAVQGHGPGLCNCCGANCSTAMDRCPTGWPPSAVTFTVAGLHDPLAPLEGQTSCQSCDEFAGLADCLNRQWKLPLTGVSTGGEITRGTSSPPIAVLCTYDYEYTCTVSVLGDPGPILGPPGARMVTTSAFLSIQIIQDPLKPYREYLITAGFGLGIGPDCASCECDYGSAIYGTAGPLEELDSVNEDDTPIILPGLPCGGPWTLTPTNAVQGNACLFADQFDAATPDELVVTTLDETPPATASDCCAPYYSSTYDCYILEGFPPACVDTRGREGAFATMADCLPACSVAESYNCDPVLGCVDPGTGLGTYTGVTALADCQAACAVTTYDCTGDPDFECVDHGGPGGTYATRGECEAACVPGTPSDTRPLCCGGTATGPDQLIAILGPDPAGCGCLVLGPTIVWAPGENAYVAAFNAGCGVGGALVAMRVRLFCVPNESGTGQWWFEVECNAGLTPQVVALFPVGPTGDGDTWDGSGTVEATDCLGCAAGTTISVLITPVGDPATQPGLCEGGGGPA